MGNWEMLKIERSLFRKHLSFAHLFDRTHTHTHTQKNRFFFE